MTLTLFHGLNAGGGRGGGAFEGADWFVLALMVFILAYWVFKFLEGRKRD